ncbi:MAG: hypothetical protein N2C14_08075, partial [Planctomycetales bacterium]
PAGPAGKGTLQFTNCWGMAADSPNQKAALDLVQYLTTADQQLAFSKAFGPMVATRPPCGNWNAKWTSSREFTVRRSSNAVKRRPSLP